MKSPRVCGGSFVGDRCAVLGRMNSPLQPDPRRSAFVMTHGAPPGCRGLPDETAWERIHSRWSATRSQFRIREKRPFGLSRMNSPLQTDPRGNAFVMTHGAPRGCRGLPDETVWERIHSRCGPQGRPAGSGSLRDPSRMNSLVCPRVRPVGGGGTEFASASQTVGEISRPSPHCKRR